MKIQSKNFRLKLPAKVFSILLLFTLTFLVCTGKNPREINLHNLGFHLIPTPQRAELSGKIVTVRPDWRVIARLGPKNMALRRLQEGVQELFNFQFKGNGTAEIILQIDSNSVRQIPNRECQKQSYKIELKARQVKISGTTETGLFYGVQTLLQLLRPGKSGGLELPQGTIVDWPRLELRFIHWDTKHHQDRLPTLKHFIDWSAFFKINAIGFEIEDKYEYPRHPIIGAPGAFTKAQMQELTRYALDRYIQLVPQVQAPAHLAYVLKHKKFAHLRADGNNYQACMCDSEAISLIRDMYQDMIEATPGVKFFHASTDEVYYAGICRKCGRPYNPENRSLTWVDYAKRTHDWMSERERKMLCWMEYPLLAKDIPQLPNDIIDAIMSLNKDEDFFKIENEKHIPQLAYSSMQGTELLFPNYFACQYRGKANPGRLAALPENVKTLLKKGANLIGTYAAAWDDAGLHNETFWLGWALVSQYGWNPESAPPEQSIPDFMKIFYGYQGLGMPENYQALQRGARFYESSWEWVTAENLPPRYGNSRGKTTNLKRRNRMIYPPDLPVLSNGILKMTPNFEKKYTAVIEKAAQMKQENNQLIQSLAQNLKNVRRNQLNVEVLLSIARFEKHFIDMMIALNETEKSLKQACRESEEQQFSNARKQLVAAREKVQRILKDRKKMWAELKQTWEKERFPKGQSVNGHRFVHVLDDVKDHFADRRPGLDYLLAPLERIGLEEWGKKLDTLIVQFSANHHLNQ